MFYFEGVAHLATLLGSVHDIELSQASNGMRSFSEQQRDDDLEFWRNMVLAMTCSNSNNLSVYFASAVDPGNSDPECNFGIANQSILPAVCCDFWCGACEDELCSS